MATSNLVWQPFLVSYVSLLSLSTAVDDNCLDPAPDLVMACTWIGCVPRDQICVGDASCVWTVCSQSPESLRTIHKLLRYCIAYVVWTYLCWLLISTYIGWKESWINRDISCHSIFCHDITERISVLIAHFSLHWLKGILDKQAHFLPQHILPWHHWKNIPIFLPHNNQNTS